MELFIGILIGFVLAVVIIFIALLYFFKDFKIF